MKEGIIDNLKFKFHNKYMKSGNNFSSGVEQLRERVTTMDSSIEYSDASISTLMTTIVERVLEVRSYFVAAHDIFLDSKLDDNDYRSAIKEFHTIIRDKIRILQVCELNLRSDRLEEGRWERMVPNGVDTKNCDYLGLNAVRNRQLTSNASYFNRASYLLQFEVVQTLIRAKNINNECEPTAIDPYFLFGVGSIFTKNPSKYRLSKASIGGKNNTSLFGGHCSDMGTVWQSFHRIPLWRGRDHQNCVFIPELTIEQRPAEDDKRINTLWKHTNKFDALYLREPRTHAYTACLSAYVLDVIQKDIEELLSPEYLFHLSKVAGRKNPDQR